MNVPFGRVLEEPRLVGAVVDVDVALRVGRDPHVLAGVDAGRVLEEVGHRFVRNDRHVGRRGRFAPKATTGAAPAIARVTRHDTTRRFMERTSGTAPRGHAAELGGNLHESRPTIKPNATAVSRRAGCRVRPCRRPWNALGRHHAGSRDCSRDVRPTRFARAAPLALVVPIAGPDGAEATFCPRATQMGMSLRQLMQ